MIREPKESNIVRLDKNCLILISVMEKQTSILFKTTEEDLEVVMCDEDFKYFRNKIKKVNHKLGGLRRWKNEKSTRKENDINFNGNSKSKNKGRRNFRVL